MLAFLNGYRRVLQGFGKGLVRPSPGSNPGLTRVWLAVIAGLCMGETHASGGLGPNLVRTIPKADPDKTQGGPDQIIFFVNVS